MTNIAANIMGDAEAFARTFIGLGYEKSSIEGALVRKFNLTSDQAATIIAAGSTNQEASNGT